MSGQKAKKRNIAAIMLAVSLVMMLCGSWLGSFAHSGWNNVIVKDVQYFSEDGALLRGLLYIPKSALGQENAVPGIVACHGYNNTAEVQSINSIELSRRGIVVFAIDAYGHGQSTFAEGVSGGIVDDMGTYSALQYLGTLPYVNTNKIGMVGHSMGGSAIQNAAFRAWKNKENDPSIVAPISVLPTSQAFTLDTENEPLLKQYPVNLGVVFGKYDEWAKAMWDKDKGSEVNTSAKAMAVVGVPTIEFGKYYSNTTKTEMDRNSAIANSSFGDLRVMYQPNVSHPALHFSTNAEANIIDFFDITLMDGKNTLPAQDQIWIWKEIFTGIALIGFFIFIPSFAVIMLKTKVFGTIVRPQPLSPSNPKKPKQILWYIVIYILCLIPAPLIYNWSTGYPINIKSMGRAVPTVFPANNIFPMPTANGLVVFNLITGAISLAIFYIVYKLVMVKRGVTFGNLGIKLEKKEILKSLLLAVLVFGAGYACLALADSMFKVDFRFWVFSIKTITAPKVKMFLTYLPFFGFSFIISSLTLNSFTRIREAKEWQNILLMSFASMGGLLIFFAADYISLFVTGIKLFPTINVLGSEVISALAGVLLMGLLFILPISAIISRILFKKTGSIWLGGFVNAFVVTFFAISNTVVSAGVL